MARTRRKSKAETRLERQYLMLGQLRKEMEEANRRRGLKSLEDALVIASLDERVKQLERWRAGDCERIAALEKQANREIFATVIMPPPEMPQCRRCPSASAAAPPLHRRIYRRIVAWFNEIPPAESSYNCEHPIPRGK